MAANLSLVQSNVQRILADNFSGVELWKSGFSLRHNSARIFVEMVEQQDRVLVKLTTPLLNGCRPTAELFKHIALHGDDYFFGHLSAHEREGQVDVYFTHVLLGDYLDDLELCYAVGGMLSTADDLDDTLVGTFGGERFHED